MRAVIVRRFGEADVLSLAHRPKPDAQLGHVVLQMAYAGVIWIRLVLIPRPFIIITIITLALIGAFSVRSNTSDVFLAIGFGVFGFLVRRAGLSVLPIVLALVLGHLVEEHFRRSLLMSYAGIRIYLERPTALVILLIAIGTFLNPVWRAPGRRITQQRMDPACMDPA